MCHGLFFFFLVYMSLVDSHNNDIQYVDVMIGNANVVLKLIKCFIMFVTIDS